MEAKGQATRNMIRVPETYMDMVLIRNVWLHPIESLSMAGVGPDLFAGVRALQTLFV